MRLAVQLCKARDLAKEQAKELHDKLKERDRRLLESKQSIDTLSRQLRIGGVVPSSGPGSRPRHAGDTSPSSQVGPSRTCRLGTCHGRCRRGRLGTAKLAGLSILERTGRTLYTQSLLCYAVRIPRQRLLGQQRTILSACLCEGRCIRRWRTWRAKIASCAASYRN